MVGVRAGKVLSDIVVEKCIRCDIVSQLNNEPELHDFLQNYEGSSKEMEVDSVLVSKQIILQEGFYC